LAVYERTYRAYAGELTPERSRFLVLPRYAYHDVFRSKLFVAFLGICWISFLSVALIIYLPHNLGFLKIFQVSTEQILQVFQYDASFFFFAVMFPSGFMAFVVAFVMGPALISSDMRNNALPLYFSRPFGRWEYILGKTAVLIILLSVVTWIPGLLLFALQSYLMGFEWLGDNLRIGAAIFFGEWIWILILCLVSLAISAYVKWKPVARITLLFIWFVLTAVAQMINLMLGTVWGTVIDLWNLIGVVWQGMLGIHGAGDLPLAAAWLALLAACGACVGLLSRKIRAYEVIRS
jgi:ABC-2 type transport system permease protein